MIRPPQSAGFLLAIVVFGLVGTVVELLLLEHYEDSWQFVPLFFIGATLVVVAAHVVLRSAGSVLMLRLMMSFLIASGVAGVVLHYRGSMEFQLEMDATQSRLAALHEGRSGQGAADARARGHGTIGTARSAVYVSASGARPPGALSDSRSVDMTLMTEHCSLLTALALVDRGLATTARGQVGKGIADLNSMPEACARRASRHEPGRRESFRRSATVRQYHRGQRVSARARS